MSQKCHRLVNQWQAIVWLKKGLETNLDYARVPNRLQALLVSNCFNVTAQQAASLKFGLFELFKIKLLHMRKREWSLTVFSALNNFCFLLKHFTIQ